MYRGIIKCTFPAPFVKKDENYTNVFLKHETFKFSPQGSFGASVPPEPDETSLLLSQANGSTDRSRSNAWIQQFTGLFCSCSETHLTSTSETLAQAQSVPTTSSSPRWLSLLLLRLRGKKNTFTPCPIKRFQLRTRQKHRSVLLHVAADVKVWKRIHQMFHPVIVQLVPRQTAGRRIRNEETGIVVTFWEIVCCRFRTRDKKAAECAVGSEAACSLQQRRLLSNKNLWICEQTHRRRD